MASTTDAQLETIGVDVTLAEDIVIDLIQDDRTSTSSDCSSPRPSDCDNNAFVFDDKDGLVDDIQLLLTMPEYCDVLFTVGPEKEHVYGVKAILAARSRLFHQQLHTPSCLGANTRRRRTSIGDNIKGTLKNISVSRRASNTGTDSVDPLVAGRYHTIVVEEFEPDVFRKLMEFIHCGRLCITPEILLGVLNAGEQYGIEGLKQACTRYCDVFLTPQTACVILKSVEKYIHFKATKLVLTKVLQYVDQNIGDMAGQRNFFLQDTSATVCTLWQKYPAEKNFAAGHREFAGLPRDVILLLLSREQLEISEATKFRVAFDWSRRQLESDDFEKLREFLRPFLKCIKFHEIPAATLMKFVRPLNIISDEVLINALAYQADPTSANLETPDVYRRTMSTLSLEPSPQDGKRKLSSTSDKGDTFASK
ncbi:serine-enriched protein-like [Lineus longissimus]|uniref:serine-enriched protein-like n=1 Tax=Lineus longissimus TaxID=88925 RepID=UPI00315C91A0